jgi:CheY-like chemotaxis protein
MISIMLKPIYQEVFHEKTDAEAVEICRNNPDPGLVLIDVRMEEMGAPEVICQMRELDDGLIIIALTAYGLSSGNLIAMDALSNECLSKPILKNVVLFWGGIRLLIEYSSREILRNNRHPSSHSKSFS